MNLELRHDFKQVLIDLENLYAELMSQDDIDKYKETLDVLLMLKNNMYTNFQIFVNEDK